MRTEPRKAQLGSQHRIGTHKSASRLERPLSWPSKRAAPPGHRGGLNARATGTPRPSLSAAPIRSAFRRPAQRAVLRRTGRAHSSLGQALPCHTCAPRQAAARLRNWRARSVCVFFVVVDGATLNWRLRAQSIKRDVISLLRSPARTASERTPCPAGAARRMRGYHPCSQRCIRSWFREPWT
jgi:hypothetical protein